MNERKKQLRVLAAISVYILFMGAFVYGFNSRVNSPDEAANVLFAKSWRSELRLSVDLPVKSPSAYPLFARSTLPNANGVSIAGWWGMPIVYGTFAMIFSVDALPYFTIVLTVISAFALRYILRRVGFERIAEISKWIFLFHPAVLYYTARGLFPNMPLIDFALIAIAAALYAMASVRAVERIAIGALAILSAGVAILIRPPEALFIFAGVALAYAWRGAKRAKIISLSVVCCVIAIAVVGFLARSSGLFPGGYEFIKGNFILPFGVHPWLMARNVFNYFILLLWPWTISALCGMLYLLREALVDTAIKTRIQRFAIATLPFSLWLITAYGSWNVRDNPDSTAVTMGVSYVRYWLPILIAIIPFIGSAFLWIAKYFKNRENIALKILLIIFCLIGIVRALFWNDGLLFVLKETRSAHEIVERVNTLVPRGAVIAVRSWDKYFFQDHAVLQPFPFDSRTILAARELVNRGTQVFAFVRTLTDIDLLWLRHNGISITEIESFGAHSLYELHL